MPFFIVSHAWKPPGATAALHCLTAQRMKKSVDYLYRWVANVEVCEYIHILFLRCSGPAAVDTQRVWEFACGWIETSRLRLTGDRYVKWEDTKSRVKDKKRGLLFRITCYLWYHDAVLQSQLQHAWASKWLKLTLFVLIVSFKTNKQTVVWKHKQQQNTLAS